MLHQQTKFHISGLNDAALLEYVLMGSRLYAPEAIAFAKEVLENRHLTAEQLELFRLPIIERVAQYDAQNPSDPMRPASTTAILCQQCQCEVPNRYVEFHQSIGAIHLVHTKTYAGYFCKRCNRKFFWKSTLTTLFWGWWGFFAFFFSVSYLITNLLTFLRTIFLEKPPPNATPPHLEEATLNKIAPFVEIISEQLIDGKNASDISRDIARQVNVNPGQVLCFIQTVLKPQTAPVRKT